MAKNTEKKNQRTEISAEEELSEIEETRRALAYILEEAEEEKDKIMAIIGNLADGLLFFDRGNRLSLINPQAEKIFGIKGQDLIGKTIFELNNFPGIKSVASLLEEGRVRIFREELQLKDNLILELTASPALKKNERFGTLVILRDVTREKLAERMKTEFVTLAAHQLRTPLSAIKWTLRILLDGDLGEINSEQKDFLEKTYQSNERMINLINDLLDVARIEEGRYLHRPTLTSIEIIVQSVISSYKGQVERKEIKLQFLKPQASLPQVKIDVEKMRSVVQNLIDNAVRYTPKGGEITISLKKINQDIEFAVKDNGVGIPEEQKKRVFSRFFRAANVIRMETEGTGLGLFISKNIIEAHGGKIAFESKEGSGSIFRFSIPIKNNSAEEE